MSTKKKHYVVKKDVLMVWNFPNCKKREKIDAGSLIDAGTPFCPDCEEDFEFSHFLVNLPLKSSKLKGMGFPANLG